jgi:phenylalanyl-tRNA synthetase beta chain
MKISLNWLKKYIDIRISAEELAEQLTMVGFEVESIENLGEKFRSFVVGEVLEVNRHPNADRLTLCKVNVGSQTLQIVCGAPNVQPKQKVAVGLAGAVVPHNQHDPDGKPFTLSQVKVRNEDSYGMICSEYELGLGDNRDGIMILVSKAKLGMPLSDYLHLNDTIFEVGITPNRPDAMSHIGIAKEVGALLGKKVSYPSAKIKESKHQVKSFAKISVVDAKNCPRYSARIIFGVRVTDSPEWLRERLTAVGIRPVNNIVDITNYVLMEYGHPLHAFDYDKISDGKIVVRSAISPESMVTLDHKVRALRDDTLLICDAKRPVGIAGVMGGENTEISNMTTNIMIESAYFSPQSVRRTAKHFGLNTDASQRFERGADPNATVQALNRATSLIQHHCGGDVLRGVLDVYPKKVHSRNVTLRVDRTNEVLGTTLSRAMISSFLKKLSIQEVPSSLKGRKHGYGVYRIPTNRPDIIDEIDLIEEVARIYGYNNIETRTGTGVHLPDRSPKPEFIDELRTWIIGSGFQEVVANSMQEESVASLGSQHIVQIANPISKDMAALRTSLVPGILSIIRENIFHGIKDLRLFEIGKVYWHLPDEAPNLLSAYHEEYRIILAFVGSASPMNWDQPSRMVDIFDVKGEVSTLFSKIFLDKFKFIPYPTTNALTQSGIRIEIHEKDAGYIATIRKDILQQYEIEQDVLVLEMSVQVLQENIRSQHRYSPLSRYPYVTRDIALIVDERVPVELLEKEIVETGSSLLKKLELFDIYKGNQITQGKKSCAFALQFLSEDHTLTQEEVDRLMQKILDKVSVKYNATLRST